MYSFHDVFMSTFALRDMFLAGSLLEGTEHALAFIASRHSLIDTGGWVLRRDKTCTKYTPAVI